MKYNDKNNNKNNDKYNDKYNNIDNYNAQYNNNYINKTRSNQRKYITSIDKRINNNNSRRRIKYGCMFIIFLYKF